MTIYREWRIKVDWTREVAARVDPPHFVQNDTAAVRLTVDMVNDRAIIDIADYYKLMVLVVRPDGQAVMNEATWVDENTAELIFSGSMLEVAGKGRVHLGLFGGNAERLTHEKSLTFIVGEDPGFCDDDTIIGTTEYGILSQLIQEVHDIQTASQLQYHWDGDKLGIKRIDEMDYTYSSPLTGPMPTMEWSEILNKPPLLENFDQHTLNYVHRQIEESDLWIVEHNLDKPYVNVIIFDSFDEEIVASSRIINSNMIAITFSLPTRGKAYIS